jgi:DNA invertase Pin-like site-specific DNA recombinase
MPATGTASTRTTTHARIYLRQSSNKTDDEVAVRGQLERCVALCEERGWTYTVYTDDDTSASKGIAIRKDYLRMLEDIKAGTTAGVRQAVMVGHPDRFFRDVIEQRQWADFAVEHNLILVGPGFGDLDPSTDDGEFMGTLYAALARKEVRRKAQRQKDAHSLMVREAGRPWWPARPFGYDAPVDPMTKKWWTIRRDPGSKQILAVNEIRKHRKEAALVKEAYRRFNTGTKLWTIAADWNKAGVTTPRGKQWSMSQVRGLLLAERNAGLRMYDGVEYQGTWPEIVKPEVWRQAVRRLQDPTRRCGIDRGRKHLLSGIALCGLCGATLTSTVNGRGQRQYVCIAKDCQKIARNGDRVDNLIIEAVLRRLSQDDAVDLLRPKVAEVDAAALREERRALRDKLTQLGKDFASAPPEFTQAALADINGRLREIDALLTDPGKACIFEGVIGAKNVRKAYLGLDLGRRRTIVDALMIITINPAKRGPVWDPDAIVNGKRAVDVVWREDL